MGFQWSQEPYRWLYQVAEHYTSAVITAGRKKAYEHAKEAEDWMKANAPWTDRTEIERQIASYADQRLKRKRHSVPMPFGARKGLTARVTSEAKANSDYERGLRQAKAAEAALHSARADQRAKTIQGLSETILSRVGTGEGKITQSRANNLIRDLKANYPLVHISKRESPVAQFEKAWRSDQIPVVEVTFRHHPRIWYARYLELANGGRYSIIDKTVDRYARKFFAEVKRLANLKQYRDRIAMGPEVSSGQVFAGVAGEESADTGRAYEPWSEAKRQRRSERRKYYDYDKAREWYLRRKEELMEADRGVDRKTAEARRDRAQDESWAERNKHRIERNAAYNPRTGRTEEKYNPTKRKY